MGYQESIMFCENKQQLERLCRVLNSAKPEFEEWVDVYAIGILKKPADIFDYFTGECEYVFPKGTHFVWWGGDRHPFQSGDCIKEHMIDNFGKNYTNWCCVFCEYIDNIDKFLENIEQDHKGEVQESEYISIIELESDKPISEDIIKKLE